MEHQLKEGDTFVRFSKHGTVFGVVESVFHTTVLGELCNYHKLQVRSTNGVIYDYNECFKVERKLSSGEIVNRRLFLEKLKMISMRKANL